MRKMLLHVVALLTLLALTSALAPQALAEATRCRGALGAVTVGDLVVPAGATCTLDGTTVRGTSPSAAAPPSTRRV